MFIIDIKFTSIGHLDYCIFEKCKTTFFFTILISLHLTTYIHSKKKKKTSPIVLRGQCPLVLEPWRWAFPSVLLSCMALGLLVVGWSNVAPFELLFDVSVCGSDLKMWWCTSDSPFPTLMAQIYPPFLLCVGAWSERNAFFGSQTESVHSLERWLSESCGFVSVGCGLSTGFLSRKWIGFLIMSSFMKFR